MNYLVTKTPIVVNPYTNCMNSFVNIYYDDDIMFYKKSFKNNHIILGGYCYNIYSNITTDTILDILVKNLDNLETFFHNVFQLLGKFIIIYKKNDESIKIFNDATSMRYIFYTKDVKNNILATNDIFKYDYKTNTISTRGGTVGNCSNMNNVFILTPNVMLDCETKQLIRFYPTFFKQKLFESVNPVNKYNNNMGDFIEFTIDIIGNLLKKIFGEKRKIIASLTGGVDSRTILTLLKKFNLEKNVEFFTYTREHDIVLAKKIASEFKLKHKIFNLTGKLDNFPIPKKSVYHKKELIKIYKENFKKENLYLRGQAFEIAFNSVDGGLSKMNKTKIRNIGKELNMDIDNLSYQDYKKIIYRFWEKLQKKNIINSESFKKFDTYLDEINLKYIIDNNLENLSDFWYWEHRMGTWVGPCVYGDSDHAFETLIIFNNWYLLHMFLLLPENKRIKVNTGFLKTLIRENNLKLSEFRYS
jgi:hypothetical protein